MARIFIDGKPYSAAKGELLSVVLRRAGRPVSQPCGGNGTCGKCRVLVNGRPVLACSYRISSDITVTLPVSEAARFAAETGETDAAPVNAALALDIGTTTLALALVSLDEGRAVRTVTRVNPQRAYGADVMNRIGYCRDHGTAALQQAVLETVREMLRALGSPAAETLFVAGNTTMLHLFFGVDPSGMGTAPYTPAFLDMRTVPGAALGLPNVKHVVSLPGAAAFVGADLTAGLGFVGLPPAGRYRLLIDLGTNAEIVLFSALGAKCTAAAAGPCFEGANISCGMSAVRGAVYACDAAGYRTVDDAPAVGLCGTGLIDVIAVLLQKGLIDETGYMEDEHYEIAPGVTLTQIDVRQYQLAKSAVSAALCTLLRRQGVTPDDIDRVYIAGGFSAKINIENAVKTGLLPPELQTKCVAVGNGSLLGTIKYACEKNDLSAFLSQTQYVDLAADPVFSELFIENMAFGAPDA